MVKCFVAFNVNVYYVKELAVPFVTASITPRCIDLIELLLESVLPTFSLISYVLININTCFFLISTLVQDDATKILTIILSPTCQYICVSH